MNAAPGCTETTQVPTPRPALAHVHSHLRLWLTMVILLGLDLWSKHWVFAHFNHREVQSFIPGVVDLQRSMNDGAVFGSFTGQVPLFVLASLAALAFVFYLFASSSSRQRVMHIALGLILAGALGNLYDRAWIKADVLKVSVAGSGDHTLIGTVVEGTPGGDIWIGAWPDGKEAQRFSADEVRSLRRQGVVRDFIKFVPKFPRWVPGLGGRDVWPWVFNIADAALVCGVLGLVLCPWGRRTHAQTEPPAEHA
ncbi:MAG TPA: signal peptidase II [Phycisphaerae bacterium]|nr:signal peptidase II [Phycisphaerae bacterium]HNU44977.1 signal peptidase II [Phycisphaerae bacterium]